MCLCRCVQYHAPGTSRQEEYGYHSGYSPTPGTEVKALRMQRGFPGTCLWNTVVMWTNAKKEETEDTEQVPTKSLALTFIKASSLNVCARSLTTLFLPIVQLDVEDVRKHVADYKRSDHSFELLKVPPCSIITTLHILLIHTIIITTTRRRPCTRWSRPSNTTVSSPDKSAHTDTRSCVDTA